MRTNSLVYCPLPARKVVEGDAVGPCGKYSECARHWVGEPSSPRHGAPNESSGREGRNPKNWRAGECPQVARYGWTQWQGVLRRGSGARHVPCLRRRHARDLGNGQMTLATINHTPRRSCAWVFAACSALECQPSAPPVTLPHALLDPAGPAASAIEQPARAGAAPLSLEHWRHMVSTLSLPGASSSPGYVCQNGSYLQVAKSLVARAPADGVYIGVGQDENLSYIALTRPVLALVVGSNHDQLLLQLMYKALFEIAADRQAFLVGLLGADGSELRPASPDDRLSLLMDRVGRLPRTEASFESAHRAIQRRVVSFGLDLGPDANSKLRDVHQAFFRRGLELRHAPNDRTGNPETFPTLRTVLESVSPDGAVRSFLGTSAYFDSVRRLHASNRIVPLVGTLPDALPVVAAFLRQRSLEVGVVHVSSTELAIATPQAFAKWTRSLATLPKSKGALFIRAYLHQGKPHPAQMPGQVGATVLVPMRVFDEVFAGKSEATYYDLCTVGVLP